ncbi:MAG TPA: outer membrane beta-barrel protein [Puia sp.]|nr:outer membrane beta-barrel protein [Puia sp.]
MGENLHNHVDDRLKGSLLLHKTKPSENVWNKIEDELEKDEKRITIIRSTRFVTLALCLIIISGISIFRYWSVKNDKPYIARPLHNISIKTPLHNISGKTVVSVKNPPTIITKPEKNLISKQNILLEIPDEEYTMANLHFPAVQGNEMEINRIHMNQVKQSYDFAIKEDLLIHQDKKSLGKKFSFTPYFSHEFAGYNPVDHDTRGSNGKEIDVQQRNVFSASAGVYFNFKVNKNLTIQSGVSYSWANSYLDSSKSYAVKDYEGNIQFKLNTNTGYGYLKPSSVVPPNIGDSILTAKTYSQLHYLTIPLVLSYNISMKRFSLMVGGGVTFNIKTSGMLETETYGPGYPEKEYNVNILGLKKTNFGMILKADLQYHINSRIGIDLIPSFKNTLGPINLPGALSAYPYNFGIGLGVSYRL